MNRQPCHVIVPARAMRKARPSSTTEPLESGSRPKSTLLIGLRGRKSVPQPVVFTSDHMAHPNQAIANEWQAAVNLMASRRFRSN